MKFLGISKTEVVKNIANIFLLRTLIFGILLSLILSIIRFNYQWQNLFYTNDGFTIYSFLRNFINGYGTYEGPDAQYLLGVHSFITPIILSPIIYIFKTPYILGIIVISIYLISSYFVITLSRNHGLPRIYSYIIGSIFFIQVFSSNGIDSKWLFQADLVAIPLIIGLFIAAKNNNREYFLLCLCLIILTKEEFILWSLFLIPLSLLSSNSRFLVNIKDFIKICSVYITSSLISIFTLIYFRSMNDGAHGARDISGIISISDINYASIIKHVFYPFTYLFVWLLLSLTLLTISNQNQKKNLILCLFLGICLILLRLFVNSIVYGHASGASWSTLSILSPALTCTFIHFISTAYNFNSFIFQRYITKLAFIGFTLTLIFGTLLKHFDFKMISYQSSEISNYNILSEFKRFVPDQISNNEYFLSDMNLMAPFMSRSHLNVGFALTQKKRLDNLVNNASFAILDKNNKDFIKMSLLLMKSNWRSIEDKYGKGYILFLPNSN